MKQTLLLISALFLLSGCGSKTAKPVANDESVAPVDTFVSDVTPPDPSSDEIVQNAIAKFLKGDKDAVRFTERAKRDLYESSSWPEVWCRRGRCLTALRVSKIWWSRRLAPVSTNMSASARHMGIGSLTSPRFLHTSPVMEWLRLRESSGMMPNQSHSQTCNKATWLKIQNTVSEFPNCMTPSSEIWVDEVPASLYRWNYEDVCLACWPLLGAWAVTDYPDTDSYLTEDVHVKNITYRSGDDSVFSGYATDGRIWYMKKKLTKGGEVTHAKILVLLYPKAMQSDVEKLIEVVKGW